MVTSLHLHSGHLADAFIQSDLTGSYIHPHTDSGVKPCKATAEEIGVGWLGIEVVTFRVTIPPAVPPEPSWPLRFLIDSGCLWLRLLFQRLEVVLDPWIEGVWDAIKAALSKMSSSSHPPLKETLSDMTKENPAPTSPPHVELNRLSLADNKTPDSIKAPFDSDSKLTLGGLPSTEVTGLSSESDVAAAKSAQEAQTDQVREECVVAEPSLTYSLPPLSQSSLNVPALPPPYLEVTLLLEDKAEKVSGSVQ